MLSQKENEKRGELFAGSWEMFQTLGEGSFGEVKLLINRVSGEAVAMKQVDLRLHPDQEIAVKKEVGILTGLAGHENIIRCKAKRLEKGLFFYIFLEYADGGELFDRIEPDVGMKPAKAQFYFRQLINGVEYMHSKGIAHRDLKPENILLTKNDVLKISDFGMATVFRSKGNVRKCTTRCGTLPYAAPEVLLGLAYDADLADIWSCGVILVAMLAGELPWDQPALACRDFRDWRDKVNLDRNPWSKIETVAISLLRIILACNAENRAKVSRIKQHRWFMKEHNSQSQQSQTPVCSRYVNEDCAQPKRKRLRVNQDVGYSQPADSGVDRRSRSPADPETSGENSECLRDLVNVDNEFAISVKATSFSQPANFDSMLVESQSQSQSQTTVTPVQQFVKRMTRFCVAVPVDKCLQTIAHVCENAHFSVKSLPPNQLSVTTNDKRKNPLTFKITVYTMSDKVLVDCRLSKGDGLEFKRKFLFLKSKLKKIVCGDSLTWLQQFGLVATSEELGNLSL